MLRSTRTFACAWALLLIAGFGEVSGQDLRNQFGTRSAEAAEALGKGMAFVQNGKPAEALPHLEQAITADPELELAYYWKALAHTDLGNLDVAFEQYEQIVKAAERGRVTNVTVDACINAGLTYIKIEEKEKAIRWLTRAVLLDPLDTHQLHWKAHRNTAIAMHLDGRNLSAVMSAVAARIADERKIDPDFLADLIRRVEDSEESGRALHFDSPPVKLDAREIATELTPIDPVELPSETIRELHPLPELNGMVAVLHGEERQWAIITAEQGHRPRVFEGPGKVLTAAVVGGRIFASIDEGRSIVEVSPENGEALQRWEVSPPAGSLAPLPAQQVIMYVGGGKLHRLDMETGKTNSTDFTGHAVAADPRQQSFYSYYVDRGRGPTSGHVIINGRPVFFHAVPTKIDWSQTILIQFAVARKEPLLAAIRLNAASNGSQLHVSPDGLFVGVVGGGGWRPAGGGGGYGAALFSTADFTEPQAFLTIDAYPTKAAVNPVTRQIALRNQKEVVVRHLSGKGEPVTIAESGGGAIAWSPDGRFLYVGGDGLKIYENRVTGEEAAAGLNWVESLRAASSAGEEPGSAEPLQTLAELQRFELRSDREAILERVRVALERRSRTKPQEWLQHEPYQQDETLATLFRGVVNRVDAGEAGIRIYRLRKARETHAGHPGIELLLGVNYYVANQQDLAGMHLAAAVKTDAGKTNISLEALRCLAHVCRKQGDPEGAAYCMAQALAIDLADPNLLAEAAEFFQSAGLERETAELLELGRSGALASIRAEGVKLPAFITAEPGKALPGDEVFRAAAPSVVLVRAGDSSGSGVCFGEPGFLLTNDHVIADRPDGVQVVPFAWVGEELVRLEPVRAQVVLRSAAHDLAVLRVADPPASLLPLPFAAGVPRVGSKVFALGSPGLGRTILEQSFSDGIVSSASRNLRGMEFLQHTAAVNSGNSGGPLLNESGQILGIVTLKAELENTSFAIPVGRVKTLFESP